MVDVAIFTLGIACTWLAGFAQKTGKLRYVWLIVLCLTLIGGLRSVNVGIDTKNYMPMFENVAVGNLDAVYGAERSFLKTLQFFSKSPSFLIFLFSLITNAFIVFRLWEFRGQISFARAFIYSYACFHFLTFNIVRQMVAVAIIFWSTRYVQKEKNIPYLVAVIAASLFHQSAFERIQYKMSQLINKLKERD